MNETERRRSVCEACAAYRRGEIRIETWCRRFDDQPDAARNCEAARNARWAARVTHDGAANACRQWLDADTCPVCRIDDPIPDPELYREQPPPAGWLEDPARIARHFAAFREMMGRDFQPPDGLAGEGIVTYGDARVWPMLVVAAKMLRATGSTLPLQIWHVGPVGKELDGDRYTTLVDADYFAQRHPGRKINAWARKSWAIAHSGFARVLFLDPDAYAVADPRPLFTLLDDRGLAYWADLPSFADRTPYPFLAPLVREDGWVPPVQAGHLLIDLRKAWTELMLVRWYDNHADFWWRVHAGEDQGGWRTVLSATNDYRLIGNADWEGCAFVCRHDGRPWVVHRCQGKFWRAGPDATNPNLPGEAQALCFLAAVCPTLAPRMDDSFQARKDRVLAGRQRLLARSTKAQTGK